MLFVLKADVELLLQNKMNNDKNYFDDLKDFENTPDFDSGYCFLQGFWRLYSHHFTIIRSSNHKVNKFKIFE